MAGPGAWYVRAAGKLWGPYAAPQIVAFVEQGRVAAETLLARSPAGPFAPAGRQPQFAALFAAERPATGARCLLVWVTAEPARLGEVEAVLEGQGGVAIDLGLWLVRSPLGPAALRNELSRGLRGADRLMVVEARAEDAAWFNVDGGTDRRMRRLWSDS